ncbi:MAG: PLP-dependent aminotransferase family protein [Acidaminococcaceae bacterium]
MLTTTFTFKQASATPKYQQLVTYFKNAIKLRHLGTTAALPSIRKLATTLEVSRTTVETAYAILLAEGYIISKPQRGYYAVDLSTSQPSATLAPAVAPQPEPTVRYNFANNYIDSRTFNTALWRRCLNNILKEPTVIASYGQAQGEQVLRTVLATYSYEARGVICTPEQIVIGAGIQSLLDVLIGILPATYHAVALEAPGFPQAERIFTDHHWQVSHFQTEKMTADLPPLLVVSPSNPYKGRALTAAERRALLTWTQTTQGLILEDDYNGEFRYFSRPISALQGLAGGASVIYLGSFSRLLMPSLRISYMVLPPSLVPCYQQVAGLYNQTSSTIEQLALAAFISGGHLRRHVRHLRKLYAVKNELLRAALQNIFGSKALVRSYASGLHLRLAIVSPHTAEDLAAKALAVGVLILPVHATTNDVYPEILLSFVGIAAEHIEPALALLKKTWFD